MAQSEANAGSAQRSRTRIAVTALFTVALVTAEFGLLYGVYHRADPVRAQRLIAVQLSAAASQALAVAGPITPDATRSSQRLSAFTADSLAQLRAKGSSPAQLGSLKDAQRRLEAGPGNAGAVREVASASAALSQTLASRQRGKDLQASAIYGGLLFFVSIGWFFWFRRLVARHRALQEAVTHQQSLATSEQRLLALVQNGADLVMVLDADSTTSFVSPSSQAVVGRAADDLLGTRVVDLVLADDVPLLIQPLARQRSGEESALTLRMRHADGRTIVAEGMLTNLVADPVVGGFVITVRDVTERHALQERLSYQAFHDSLTGLANRQLFADRLGHALERRGGAASPLVVLFCDLDNFKDVNDSRGHGVGDRVLEIVGQRLRRAIRSGDTAARLGGDEFAILMEYADLASAQPLAERVLAVACEPVEVDGVLLNVTASVGMAQAVPGEATSEEVLRNADVAMYWAKDRGRSTLASYDSALHQAALDRLALRADLQRALRARDELVLHYQPTVELSTGRITGFEALVRWQHPERGLLSPAFFVPMAEEIGLIVQLGSWVLREACRAGGQLQADWRRPSMAVNISAQQLSRENFVEEVTTALADARLPADRLVLEITESIVLQDLDAVIPRLTALRDRGVRVAIDDFGTGYSSLAYLSDLPIDILKIDKSFIDRVAIGDDQGASVTEAIIAMSRSMNLATVAEGVELAEQAQWLLGSGCTIGQGYFWSRPVELAAVRELLAASVAGSPASPMMPGASLISGLH